MWCSNILLENSYTVHLEIALTHPSTDLNRLCTQRRGERRDKNGERRGLKLLSFPHQASKPGDKCSSSYIACGFSAPHTIMMCMVTLRLTSPVKMNLNRKFSSPPKTKHRNALPNVSCAVHNLSYSTYTHSIWYTNNFSCLYQFLKQKYGYAKNKIVKLYLTVTKYCTQAQ